MNSVWKDYPGIESVPVPERIKLIKESTVELLQKGHTKEEFDKVILLLIEEELYEAAEGIKQGVAEFYKNPQLTFLS